MVVSDFLNGLQALIGEMNLSLDWLIIVPRTVVAALLVTFLPGFFLVRAAFPKRPRFDPEMVLVAVGMSLAITTCSGVILNAVNHLNATGWAVILSSVTLLSLLISVFRWVKSVQLHRTLEEYFGPIRPHLRAQPYRSVTSIRVGRAITVASVILVLTGLFLAHHGALHHREFTYSELWMQPNTGTDVSLVIVGIRNEEQRAMTYDVDLILDDAIIGQVKHIDLGEGQTWLHRVSVDIDPTLDQRVEAWLYKDDDHSLVYRKVWLAALATQRRESKLTKEVE